MEDCDILKMPQMVNIENYARKNYIPVLLTETAIELSNTLKKYCPKRVLEIGTAIGYSGTLILNSCSCQLYTVEKDEECLKIAKKHFKQFKLTNRVISKLNDANSELDNLVENNEKFDFVFLDGPKGQYIKYLPKISKILVSGGILFADNVYYKGMVQSNSFIPHKKRTIVVNLRKFIDELKNSSEFKNVKICNIGDGIAIAEKI